MAIRQLPLQLANQIAAGEVVERPSSVVKELVENSIDAGATELLIDIEQGGAKRIRIRDNGAGIEREELSLALTRHATSKIHCLDDLESIESLGFRGEALASISSVSRLTLTSKPPQQDEAWQAFCEGREMQVQLQPAAHPNGTTVDVQDLFFNTPARRKFLRTEKTEFGHIDEVLRRIALAAPHVRIVLMHNKRKVREYKPLRDFGADFSQALPRLKAIAGNSFANEALFLQHQAERWRLHGWIAPGPHCRHQGDIQYMYVNGRMMKDKLLNHAIRQAYGERLADDRQPTYVLYLHLPAREVDVNVHPAKHEVRFHQARQIHDFMLQGLQQALASYQSEPSEHTSSAAEQALGYQPPAPHLYRQPPTPPLNLKTAADSVRRDFHPEADVAAVSDIYQRLMQPAAGQGSPGADADAATALPMPQEPPMRGRNDTNISTPPLSTLDAHGWKLLQVLQQRFLLLLRADDRQQHLLGTVDLQVLQQCVEQHRLSHKLAQGLSGQPLLLPVQLQLTAALEPQTVQQLACLGVQLKLLPGQRAVVMQVPSMLRNQPIEQVLHELLERLTIQPLVEQTELHAWLAQFCIQPAYSDEQAQYWFSQALDLIHLDSFVQLLNWQAAYQ